MKVFISKDEVEKAGVKLLSLSSEYNEKVNEIKNLSDKIKHCWTGEDASAYCQLLTEKCIPALERINETIENFGNYLKKVPNVYSTFDKNAVISSKKE